MKDFCLTPTSLLENNEVVRLLQITANSIDRISFTSKSRLEIHGHTQSGFSTSSVCTNFEKHFASPTHISESMNDHMVGPGFSDFEEIQQNIYVDPVEEDIKGKCQCEPTDRCVASCLNRATYVECDQKECPCGILCTNNSIQRGAFARIEKFNTGDKGWGIKSMDKILKGHLIIEYVGEVRALDMLNDRNNVYCLRLNSNLVIDAQRKGNIARFANHSCSPNAEMHKWSVQGYPRMILSAKRNILADEEITFDYQFESFDSNNNQVCKCKSEVCRGIIGKKTKQKEKTTKEKSTNANERILRQSNGIVKAPIPMKSKAKPTFPCDCGNSFSKLSSLKRHQQRQHSTIREFICIECNKAFLHRDNLMQHEKVHTHTIIKTKKKQTKRSKKPKCNNCGSLFTKTSSLKRHVTSNTCNKENK